MTILAGDIGGTNTRLMIAEHNQHELNIIKQNDYASHLYEGLVDVVRDFLGTLAAAQQPSTACFAVAGPVQGDTAQITNLPWRLETQQLQQALGIRRVSLINDFQGVGYGIEALDENDFVVLQQGEPQPRGVRALIGAGTGLGEGMLCWCHDRYQALPSEGGHVDFAPTTETERELLHYLVRDKQRVSYEDLLSGSGLYRLYRFLRENKHGEESSAMTTALRSDSDPAAIITEYALAHADPLANQALDLFISIYGAQAGNLALTTRAHGGLYICGGIAPRIIDRIRAGRFMDAFLNKVPMTRLMESIPVRVVMNTQVGLLGAAMLAARL